MVPPPMGSRQAITQAHHPAASFGYLMEPPKSQALIGSVLKAPSRRIIHGPKEEPLDAPRKDPRTQPSEEVSPSDSRGGSDAGVIDRSSPLPPLARPTDSAAGSDLQSSLKPSASEAAMPQERYLCESSTEPFRFKRNVGDHGRQEGRHRETPVRQHMTSSPSIWDAVSKGPEHESDRLSPVHMIASATRPLAEPGFGVRRWSAPASTQILESMIGLMTEEDLAAKEEPPEMARLMGPPSLEVITPAAAGDLTGLSSPEKGDMDMQHSRPPSWTQLSPRRVSTGGSRGMSKLRDLSSGISAVSREDSSAALRLISPSSPSLQDATHNPFRRITSKLHTPRAQAMLMYASLTDDVFLSMSAPSSMTPVPSGSSPSSAAAASFMRNSTECLSRASNHSAAESLYLWTGTPPVTGNSEEDSQGAYSSQVSTMDSRGKRRGYSNQPPTSSDPVSCPPLAGPGLGSGTGDDLAASVSHVAPVNICPPPVPASAGPPLWHEVTVDPFIDPESGR